MTADLVGGAAVAGVLLAAYAGVLEPRWLQVTRRDIALPCIPEALRGLTVAHLSDIHYGRLLAPRLLEALITRTNALQPDLIALTGDFVDQYPHEVEPIARELGRLRARLGVWAVLGGHDITAGERAFRRAFAANGIHLLRNEAAPVVAGATLWVVGVRDNSRCTSTGWMPPWRRCRRARARSCWRIRPTSPGRPPSEDRPGAERAHPRRAGLRSVLRADCHRKPPGSPLCPWAAARRQHLDLHQPRRGDGPLRRALPRPPRDALHRLTHAD